MRKFLCLRCDHRWEVPFGGGRQLVCPNCGSMKIHRTNPEASPSTGRCCRKRRRQGPRDPD